MEINNKNIWIILIIVVAFIIIIAKSGKERYSQAALLQLTAKGPQDTYLSGDAWKYIPPYYYGGYYGYPSYGGYRYGYPWNISTRRNRGYYPYYRYWY